MPKRAILETRKLESVSQCALKKFENLSDILKFKIAPPEKFIIKFHLWHHLQGVNYNWKFVFVFKKSWKTYNFEAWRYILKFSENLKTRWPQGANEWELITAPITSYKLILPSPIGGSPLFTSFREVVCCHFFPDYLVYFFLNANFGKVYSDWKSDIG